MNASILPSHAPVVVIGGGIMGCSTLYHLAKRGVTDAILLERNKLTSGTTWHSAAQVRALRSSRNLTNLIKYSISLYSGLERETGQATGWIHKGSLSIATNSDRLTHIHRQEALAHAFGVAAHSISPGEALERWPLMNADDVIGAVWSPDDGRVSPSDLCAALAKGARGAGARVFEDTAVLGIVTEAGRVRGVETASGTISCDAVALCAGLWSRRVAAMADVKAPVWPCEHFYLLTKPLEGVTGNIPTLSDHDGHLYIRDDSGGLLVGCFEPGARPIDPDRLGEEFAFQLLPEDWDHFEPMMHNALHRLPALETAEVKMLLNGPESFTPDSMFLLGESAATRGFFLGCGMNSFGVAAGGGAGMALAHCITEGHPPFDLHEADPNRFAECQSSIEALTARIPEVLGKHYEIGYPGRQFASARYLRLTPLHDRWTTAGATFGQVYGWERPLYFGGLGAPRMTFGKPEWFDQVASEVKAAHETAALFEQSTLGKIWVEGADAEVFLNRVCANDMSRLPGRAIYTAMLDERGGFVEDLTVQRITTNQYRLFVGSGAPAKAMGWLRRQRREGEKVLFEDETEDFVVLGLMGPKTAHIAVNLGASDLNDIRFFSHAEAEIDGIPVRAVRLSYVGEQGWEITCAQARAAALHDAIIAAGAVPAGFHAQTSMRIEKRFLSMGHDIDADMTPLEGGLDFAIAWETPFVGREALLARREEPPRGRVMSLTFDDTTAVPIGGEPIYLDGTVVGQTTSAAFGHRVGAPVAIGYLSGVVDAEAAPISVEVNIAGHTTKAIATTGPLI
jgi:4-methylaminobutanoate oxidase (formaldehyde-forming)